jgi:hypothetical protein
MPGARTIRHHLSQVPRRAAALERARGRVVSHETEHDSGPTSLQNPRTDPHVEGFVDAKLPVLSVPPVWARGDLNPHVLSDTGT